MKYVLYHDQCCDGYGAAYAAWKKLGYVGVKYFNVAYGKPIPTEVANATKDDFVYIVDFSYSRATLDQLASHTNLVVLDHHETAEKALAGASYVQFDKARSGAMITWNYFHTEPAPLLFQYIQDRDLWNHALPHTRECAAALFSYPMDHTNFELWDKLDVEQLIKEGRIPVQKLDKDVADLVSKAKPMTLLGYPCLAVNAPFYQSDVGNALVQSGKCKIGVIYSVTKDGYLSVSLRSSKDDKITNCAVVAEHFGGGGHPCSASFTIRENVFDLFIKLITSKT